MFSRGLRIAASISLRQTARPNPCIVPLHQSLSPLLTDARRFLSVTKSTDADAVTEHLGGLVVGGDSASSLAADNFTDVPGVKTAKDRYAIVYTCKVCETRSSKQISKQAYHHGVVMLRCPGCQGLHLIADHIGMFEDKGWDIQKFLAAQGDKVEVMTQDSMFEMTWKDVVGKSKTLAVESHDEGIKVVIEGVNDKVKTADMDATAAVTGDNKKTEA